MLRAAQVVVDERLAMPILVGRPDVIAQKIKNLGLRLQLGRDAQVANFDDEAVPERGDGRLLPAQASARACRATSPPPRCAATAP